jgi:hypothetical protein
MKTSVRLFAWLLCVLFLSGWGGSLYAQPASAPASAPADDAAANHMQVTVTGIEGLVQVRVAEDQPWKKAELGMTLDEGAEFRTGPRSAVRFVIPPDQVITLDRLGTVKVIQAIRSDKMVKTDLGMKYGRTRYDIEAAGLDHQSTIHSPSATLAIRGTKVSLEDSLPFPAIARSLTGTGEFSKGKHKQKFGGKQYTEIDSEKGNAAETELDNRASDPGSSFGRTGTEEQLVDTFVSGTFDQQNNGFGGFHAQEAGGGLLAGIGTGSGDNNGGGGGGGGTPPEPEVGHLNFYVSWTGPADMDMFVVSPLGEGVAVYPPGGIPIAHSSGPATTSASGGAIVRDITSANGTEQINWANTHPIGVYNVGTRAYNAGGSNAIRIEGFLDGQRIQPVYQATVSQTGDYTFTTFNVTH